jgi:hypothetical protein
MFKVWKAFNNPLHKQILENKYIFYRHMSALRIRVVEVLGYMDHQMLMRNQEMIYLDSPEKLEEVIREIIMNDTKSKSVFIKKNNYSSGGENIYKINLSDFPLNAVKRNRLFNDLTGSSYIIQDTLIQHSRLNSLNPSSVNTIRINTFMDRNGQVEILASFFRFGMKGSFVDNISSGGGYIGVEPDSGRLRKKAYSDITHGKARTFLYHPDTGLVFEGFEIPLYREAEELVTEAARHLPELRLIGWDVAITEEEPVIIEGNDHSGIHCAELANGGFRNNKVFQKLFQEILPN